MLFRVWRITAGGFAAVIAAAALLSAQAPLPDATETFRLYMLGREVGRETSSLFTNASGRRIESSVTFKDRGADVRLTATVDSDFDWEPRRLIIRGQPFAGATTDLDVTTSGARATVRDRGADSTREIGDGLFFPIEGALPVAFQESLIAYWRNHGRPASIPSTPGGPIRILLRADEQVDVGARVVILQRLAIDGPVWGRQTAWVEPGGNLAALVTWVDGIQFQAIREGFESRLDRFVDRAMRDGVDDLDKLVVAPERIGDMVFVGATVLPGGGRPAVPDAVLMVRGGRIASLGPAAKVKVPDDLPRVDAAGMTIVPGLWDVDARLPQTHMGALHLASGITSIRTTGPDHGFAASLRAAMAEREERFLGPRLIPAGGIEGVDGDGAGLVRAGTIDEGRQAARKYRSDGLRRLDLSRWLAPDVFRATAAEGRRLGMGVAGRVPAGVSVAEAVEAGLDFVIGSPGGADTTSWLPLLAKQQIAFAPEIAAREPAQRIDALPPSLARRVALRDRPAANVDRAAWLAQVRAARDARVSVVGGSGAGAPVAGLLREIELFVEAGMTPAEALDAVTSVAARAMKTEDAGTIEPGKRADLVILSGNPLVSIANIRTARWVVVGGRMYDSAKLRALVN